MIIAVVRLLGEVDLSGLLSLFGGFLDLQYAECEESESGGSLGGCGLATEEVEKRKYSQSGVGKEVGGFEDGPPCGLDLISI